MPDLVFDGKKISVPPGTNLIEAGLEAKVPVPVFCYHKDLGAVGSCRVCAVTVTQQGKSRLVMGCMTEAADGMEVTTLDAASIQLRKYVLEWLMVNHPHDCPICDEGGECQLQDLTIAAGQAVRRIDVKKRTFPNQYLGEFIQHEMNRCITCYRCSRFYQEVAGGRDFGSMGSRDRVYFGRFEEGSLESPFSGNLIEFCPTGVFTDKLFRYKSRVWDLEIAPSVCPHCSVGCNVLPGSRHRELQRVRVRVNPEVNGTFLCDRGQFGHGYVMDKERPRDIRVRGDAMDWETALGLLGGDLLRIARDQGAQRIAFVTSARASLETHFALESLAAGPLAGAKIAHFDDPEREPRALAALAALHAAGVAPLEQSDIGRCDVLLVAGVSLVDEAPLAALAARQVARQGGRLFVMGPAEGYLADVAESVIAMHPSRLASALGAIAGRIAAGDTASPDGDAANLASALRGAKRLGILMGSDLLDGPAFAAGAELARTLRGAGTDVRLGYVFPGPNAFGAAALARGATLAGILSDLEAGNLRALVIVESEADWGSKAREALRSLGLLMVMDYLPGPLASVAHALLPTTTTYESHGIYVNRTGRAQAFAPDRVPGLSVIELIDGETFPRQPRLTPPGAVARPAWWVVENLRESAIGKPRARSLGELRAQLQRSHDRWRPLGQAHPGGPGAPLDAALFSVEAPALAAFGPPDRLMVFRTDRTLGSETLSRRSEPMRKMAGPPVASISPIDAERLRLGGAITIAVDGQSASLAVKVVPGLPQGVVIVPRDLEWPGRFAQGTLVTVTAAAREEVHA